MNNKWYLGIWMLPLLALSAFASQEPLETAPYTNEVFDALSVTSAPPQRTSLTLMTLGFIGVQYTAVYINRNDED